MLWVFGNGFIQVFMMPAVLLSLTLFSLLVIREDSLRTSKKSIPKTKTNMFNLRKYNGQIALDLN